MLHYPTNFCLYHEPMNTYGFLLRRVPQSSFPTLSTLLVLTLFYCSLCYSHYPPPLSLPLVQTPFCVDRSCRIVQSFSISASTQHPCSSNLILPRNMAWHVPIAVHFPTHHHSQPGVPLHTYGDSSQSSGNPQHLTPSTSFSSLFFFYSRKLCQQHIFTRTFVSFYGQIWTRVMFRLRIGD